MEAMQGGRVDKKEVKCKQVGLERREGVQCGYSKKKIQGNLWTREGGDVIEKVDKRVSHVNGAW